MGQPVELYLTLGEDGKAVMTGHKPVMRRVLGTNRVGIYCHPGDWLLVRNLCPEWVEKGLGLLPPMNEPLRCRLTLEVIDT